MRKSKSFIVSAKLGIEVTTVIQARDYEDAIVQIRYLKANDFVAIPNNCWQNGDIDKIIFIAEED